MQQTIDLALVQAYSRGEITRRDIEDASGQTVSFGTLLMHAGRPADRRKVLADQHHQARLAAERALGRRSG